MSALRAVSALGFGIAFLSPTLIGMADAQGLLETARRTGKITVGIYNQVPWGFQTPDGRRWMF